MKVEDYWEDVTLFLVEYVNYHGQLIVVEEFIMVPFDFPEKKMKDLIYTSFPDIDFIESVSEYTEALCEKSTLI